MRGRVCQNQLWEGESPGRETPSITLAAGLLPTIYGYVIQCVRPGGQQVETGGMLVGEFAGRDSGPSFRLTDFIGAGPLAECLPDSVLFDADYQSRTLARIQARAPQKVNVGCIHMHPEGMDACSEGDWEADMAAVRASDTRALVFGIITVNNQRQDTASVLYRDLKFDFFVLTEQSEFKYLHVSPTVERVPAQGRAEDPAKTIAIPRQHSRHSTLPLLLNDKKRLVAEVRAMEERYHGRAALRLERNSLYWEYTVTESGRHFPIRVCYPRDYPLRPPRILSMLPLPHSPHQIPGNELCWTNRSGPCDWNPGRDTAVICIHAAHRWFACLLVYLTLGKWPEGADHEPGRPL